MSYLRLILPLLLLYLLLTGNLQLSNLVVGLLIATGIVILLRPQPKLLEVRRVPDGLLAMAHYVVILAVDIIKSGLVVARLLLTPSLPIRHGIVAIPSLGESELATALSAHGITITPGEMVIEIDEQGLMYTHCLDATRADEYRLVAQKMRLELFERIFV